MAASAFAHSNATENQKPGYQAIDRSVICLLDVRSSSFLWAPSNAEVDPPLVALPNYDQYTPS